MLQCVKRPVEIFQSLPHVWPGLHVAFSFLSQTSGPPGAGGGRRPHRCSSWLGGVWTPSTEAPQTSSPTPVTGREGRPRVQDIGRMAAPSPLLDNQVASMPWSEGAELCGCFFCNLLLYFIRVAYTLSGLHTYLPASEEKSVVDVLCTYLLFFRMAYIFVYLFVVLYVCNLLSQLG